MKRIYVAGSYSANNVIEILDNIRRGIDVCTKLIIHGYSPFCPWLDFQYKLSGKGNKISKEMLYDCSLSWLKVSEAMLIIPGSGDSEGTKKEMEIAKKLGIPIFHSVEDVVKNITEK